MTKWLRARSHDRRGQTIQRNRRALRESRLSKEQTARLPNEKRDCSMTFKQKIVTALGWSVTAKLVFQLISWGMNVIVIRILSPNDYGLLAESQVFVNLFVAIGLLGFGDALVQQQDTPKEIVARAFGALLLSSIGLTSLLALAAPSIADWYNDTRLVPLVQVYSLGFLFNGFIALPQAYLTKHLRVGPLLLIDLASNLLSGVVIVILAGEGFGVWALMLGWLAANLLRMTGFIICCYDVYVWPKFDFVGLHSLFSFGVFRTVESVLWIVYTSADVLIISRLLGPTALGVYAVAMNFATIPLSKFAPIVNSIAFPAFALVQERPAEARFYALKALRLMAAASVPVFFGICATAPEMVDALFGPKWAVATPILSILALATTFRAILIMYPNYLLGIGDAQAGLWCTAAGVAVFPPAFFIGSRWGIEGIAYAWLIGYPVVFAFNSLIASLRGGLPFKAVLLVPVRPIVAGIIMLTAIAATRLVIPDGFSRAGEFIILLGVGFLTYWLVLRLIFRSLASEVLSLVYR